MKGREHRNEHAEYRGPDSRTIQRMFADIAHRYDFLNHFLSLSIDRIWRRLAVRKVQQYLRAGHSLCLDVCSGTGDLALDLHRTLGLGVVACDFCHPMLTRSNRKIEARNFQAAVRTVEADALLLPFSDATFETATNAFGLRNLEDPKRGLQEMMRILKPEGCAVILDFSKPRLPVFKHIFNFYFRSVLPRLGTIISGKSGPYQYLQSSVESFFEGEELSGLMNEVGFRDVGYRKLTGGIAALYWGRK